MDTSTKAKLKVHAVEVHDAERQPRTHAPAAWWEVLAEKATSGLSSSGAWVRADKHGVIYHGVK